MDWMAHGTLAEVLAANAVGAPTTDAFVQTLGHLLEDSPLCVARVFLSLQTLHPAFRARTYVWRSRTDQVQVTEWPHGLENRPGYFDSPDFHVRRSGREFRIRDSQHVTGRRCDPYQELKADGYTDYLMVPLRFGDGSVNTLAIAATAGAGFREDALDRFRDLTDLLVVILERYAALETVAATLATYLGRSASQEVLGGRVRAGHGELIEAVVLFADLRGFTGHSARLDPTGTVSLLNDFFDCLVGPIEAHHGHVLKFIGDAVLAFFPLRAEAPEPAPLEAVHAIRERLAELNAVRERQGEPPIRHGSCLHYGQVLYGNVGSSERLDFTIIGQAVNLTARGVEMTRALDVDEVFTGAFVARFGGAGLTPIGTFELRGIPEAVQLFALASACSGPKEARLAAAG